MTSTAFLGPSSTGQLVPILIIVALGLAVCDALAVIFLVSRRILLARKARLRFALEGRLRPLAISLVEDESVDLSALNGREHLALVTVLTRYSRQLTGEARTRISAFLERHGYVDSEIQLLHSRRTWRRATAAYTLGDLGSSNAVPALLRSLEVDSEREVRAAAARSLGVLGATESVEPLVDALATGRVPVAVAGHALMEIGTAAVPSLKVLATAPDGGVRATAAELIGYLANTSDASLMIKCLSDSSAEVRAKAARALGRLGAAEAATALRGRLDDRIPFVRTAAAHSLGLIGDTGAVPALLAQARADQFFPAEAAVLALVRIDAATVSRAGNAPGAGPHLREGADLVGVGVL